MSRARRPLPEWPFTQIEGRFTLAAVAPGMPAVTRDARGDWSIRILVHVVLSAGRTVERYDYFYLAADGTVLSAPWGHARDWKPGRITGLSDAVLAEYARRAAGDPR